MTDKYADLRAALESGPQGDEWMWANYGPKTIGIGIAGGPAFLMVRPGDMIDRDEMESIVHGLVMSRRHARALLADYDEAERALVLAGKANKDLMDAVLELKAERDRLRAAAQMLADWAEHEVGAEPDLTPGLAEARAALAQEAS